MNLSEISKALAKVFGEEQGRSISQIVADGLGINTDIVHLLMIIEGLAILGLMGIIIYLIVKKFKNTQKKK